MDSKKIFLAIALALFGVISFSKGASADVPQVVRNQLRDACREFDMYEVNYNGTRTFFEHYGGKNYIGTANWISSDINGDNNVNAVYEKRNFELSEKNRVFYINTAVLPCFNIYQSGSAVNVRINASRSDARYLITDPIEAKGEAGQGVPHSYGAHPGELKRTGKIKVIIKPEALNRFKDGDYLTFSLHQCASVESGNNVPNYPAWQDPYEYVLNSETNPGNCYSRDISIRISVPNKFNVESSTRAAVLNSSQSLNSNDSRFRDNGRSNPQVAKVGQWVSFRHRVTAKDFNRSDVQGLGSYTTFRNNGSGDTPISSNGDFIWRRYGYESQKTLINQGLLTDPVNSVNGNNETFRVTRDMAGKTICSSMAYRIEAGDVDGRNRYNQRTNEACVYVPYNFNITPCVQIDRIRNCSGGDIDVPTDGKIPPDPNNGEEIEVPDNGTATSPIKYKITTWRVPAAREGRITVNNRRDNENGDTCAANNFYSEVYQVLENCRVVREDSSGRSYDRNTRIADFVPEIEDGAEVGTRYCVALSISPYRMLDTQSRAEQEANNRQWRHSAPICIKVVKMPKVQFWGNGVFSRAGIRTSLSPTKEGVLGSWVEYEAITGGTIRNFRTESSQSTRRLAIENYTSTGNFGQGAPSIDSVISSISSKFPRQNINNSEMTINVFNEATRQIGGFSADRPTRVIYGNNLRISSDIVNSDRTVNSDNDFRQIIIIANGNITIDPGVRTVDAWLIAKGTINTCAVDGNQNEQNVTVGKCNEQLRIRGGTLSNKLKLWRTHGSDGRTASSLSEPAEIINQSVDIYLWSQTQSGGQGKIVTTYTKELPVRY